MRVAESQSLFATRAARSEALFGDAIPLEEVAVAPAPITRRVRADALPEHLRYRDEGCDAFESCLACPLPRCRYDVQGGIRQLRNRARDPVIVRRYQAGETADEIAEALGLSRRTVFRIVSERRAA